jgi:hypothetical protein
MPAKQAKAKAKSNGKVTKKERKKPAKTKQVTTPTR